MATSTTRSEQHAFATLRFAGDRLDPDEISAILHVRPTRAYRKGQVFSPGPRTPQARGRTGLWFLSTDNKVSGEDLGRHLAYLIGLIGAPGERLRQLRDILADREVKAHVSCFWHGPEGAPEPGIPADALAFFERLPAEIETDFATD